MRECVSFIFFNIWFCNFVSHVIRECIQLIFLFDQLNFEVFFNTLSRSSYLLCKVSFMYVVKIKAMPIFMHLWHCNRVNVDVIWFLLGLSVKPGRCYVFFLYFLVMPNCLRINNIVVGCTQNLKYSFVRPSFWAFVFANVLFCKKKFTGKWNEQKNATKYCIRNNLFK